jgi:hypothetical protein
MSSAPGIFSAMTREQLLDYLDRADLAAWEGEEGAAGRGDAAAGELISRGRP